MGDFKVHDYKVYMKLWKGPEKHWNGQKIEII